MLNGFWGDLWDMVTFRTIWDPKPYVAPPPVCPKPAPVPASDDVIADSIAQARSDAAFFEAINVKGPFPISLTGGFTQLAPLGPNLVEHYWQWGPTDEYWWGTYLVDLLKQHAQDRTLTYRNFKNWYDDTYGGGALTRYLEYLQVYPLEFERVVFWLSRNPDKINFDTLKRLLRSMRLVLMIDGVGTSKVRYMYSDADIMLDLEGCLPHIYKGFRLFNTLQFKMTKEQGQTMKPYIDAMMKAMYGTPTARADRHVEMKMLAVIVAATNLGIKIPYRPT